MAEQDAKGLRALLAVLRNDPFAVDFVKLAEASPVLLEEVKQQPQAAKILEAKITGADEFRRAVLNDEALIDWAYDQKILRLGKLPPKNVKSYQVITSEEYSWLTNPADHFAEGTRINSKLMRQYKERWKALHGKEIEALDSVDEIFSQIAYFSMVGAVWMAKNFTLKEEYVPWMFTSAAYQGKLSLLKKIYENYDEIDWQEWLNRTPYYDHPFYKSLTEDRAAVAHWLAETFDVTSLFGQAGLFSFLILLNNVDAIKWLIREYELPMDAFMKPAYIRGGPARALQILSNSGRKEFANFLSRHYGIEPTKLSAGQIASDLLPDPPLSKRMSDYSKS